MEAQVRIAMEYLEAAEIMADPKAMKAIRDAERRRTKFYRLDTFPIKQSKLDTVADYGNFVGNG